MDIPRSTYYYQKTENTVKTNRSSIAYHRPYYGYRRITAQLPREKIKVNHKRVLKIMGIQGSLKRSYIATTNSKHSNPIYPNLIKDQIVTAINQVWCSDIIYIRILSGFVYLAAIIDIYSCIFRPHPDTDSGNIRTAFRNYPDSITAYPDTLSND